MRNFKKAARLAAAAMMILSLGWMAAPAASQNDSLQAPAAPTVPTTNYYAYIPDHSIYFVDAGTDYAWAYRAIDYLAGGGVVSGVGGHLFAPDKPITRADFMVMLYRAYDMHSYTAEATFSDVPADAYYAEAVGAAEALGIAAGTSGKFFPGEKVTREDAVVFLKRTLDRTGLRLPQGSLSGFTDADKVSPYAVEAAAALSQAGILSGGGDGQLHPQEEMTRAEMAALLYRALHLSDAGVYAHASDLINLCIGDTIYTDVRIEGYQPGHNYTGLVRCLTFYETENGYFIELGGTERIDQQVVFEDGRLTVDGQSMALAKDVVCVNVNPYSTLEEPVSTGGHYQKAKVAILDELVTEIYYSA